jgi:iron complex transport system substrate-binding protein
MSSRPHISRTAHVVALVALFATAAACGSDDSDSASTTVADVVASTTTAAPSSPTIREVSDIHGPVSVPADPQRVVVMESQSLGNLLAIGFPADRIVGYPVGIGGTFADSPELSALIDPANLGDIGDFGEPNLEAIIALQPDLIVTTGALGDDFYDEQWAGLQSTGIPVFVALNGYETFEAAMQMLADAGEAVNLEDEALRVETQLRDRVASMTAEVAASDVPDTGYVRLNRADNTVYVEASPWLTLLGVPGPRPTLEEYAKDYSDELLDEALGSYELLFVAERIVDGEFVDRLESNPLWPTLPAVVDEQVYIVSENSWKGYSAPAISWILDDVERILLP